MNLPRPHLQPFVARMDQLKLRSSELGHHAAALVACSHRVVHDARNHRLEAQIARSLEAVRSRRTAL
ncbi:MAG TPA: hypothetical protein VGF58_14720 [Burkholderiales bacterium]